MSKAEQARSTPRQLAAERQLLALKNRLAEACLQSDHGYLRQICFEEMRRRWELMIRRHERACTGENVTQQVRLLYVQEVLRIRAISTSGTKYRKPKPTEKAVRAWFRERVATWPDDQTAPTEAVDYADITSHFGDGLTRKDFRPIREAETPRQWRTRGRRSLWGQIKKLPPQW